MSNSCVEKKTLDNFRCNVKKYKEFSGIKTCIVFLKRILLNKNTYEVKYKMY